MEVAATAGVLHTTALVVMLLGVLGMLLCVHGRRTVWEPDTPQLVQLEGWVFGRAAPPPAAVD